MFRPSTLAACTATLLLGLAACERMPEGVTRAAGERPPAARVDAIARIAAASPESELAGLMLRTPCELTAGWKHGPATEHGVADLEPLVDTDAASGQYLVFLRDRSLPGEPPRLLAATRDADQLTRLRAELSRLRTECVEWAQRPQTAPTPAGTV